MQFSHYPIPPTSQLWHSGGTLQLWMQCKMCSAFGKDSPEPKHQMSGDTFAHVMEMREIQVFRKQTCKQSLPSFGEVSPRAFSYFSCSDVFGENSLACDCSEEQQFTSGCCCLCLFTQPRRSRARMGNLCHQRTLLKPHQSGISVTSLQRAHIYFFTCTCATIQQPSATKTMEVKGDQILLSFDQ